MARLPHHPVFCLPNLFDYRLDALLSDSSLDVWSNLRPWALRTIYLAFLYHGLEDIKFSCRMQFHLKQSEIRVVLLIRLYRQKLGIYSSSSP